MPDAIKHRHTARLRPAILSVMRSCACEVWSEEALRHHLRATTPVWMLRTALDILIEECHVRRVIDSPGVGTAYALITPLKD